MEASLLIQYIITEKQSNQINTPWWNKEKSPNDSQIVRDTKKPLSLTTVGHYAHIW